MCVRTAAGAHRRTEQATGVLPDGSEVVLDTMRVRATEYTTGELGPEAMLGTLPPTSGYTYAVELSVDEADAMGASSVVFDRPVGFYLENFTDFPVGATVPLGYYDRERAAWVPSESAVVLAIVDELDGLAEIDLDGDELAETDDARAHRRGREPVLPAPSLPGIPPFSTPPQRADPG